MEMLDSLKSMFTDGCNNLEMISLILGTIVGIVSLFLLFSKSTRKSGLFTLIVDLFYTLAIFITANDYATALSIAICVVISLTLNILGWVLVCGYSGKKAFKTLLSGCFIVVFLCWFIYGFLSALLSLSILAMLQFFILFTFLILNAAVVFFGILDNTSYGNSSNSEDHDPLRDMTEDMNSVDITWMDDGPSDSNY